MKKILLIIMSLGASLCLLSQDEEYTNERVTNAMPQYFSGQGVAYDTDAERNHRFTYERGTFCFDNFYLAGQAVFLTEESGSLGLGGGLLIRNYALNGAVRIFGQLELSRMVLYTPFQSERIMNSYTEYALEAGLSHPLDFDSESLSAELFFRYAEPLSDPLYSSQGATVGVRFIFIY